MELRTSGTNRGTRFLKVIVDIKLSTILLYNNYKLRKLHCINTWHDQNPNTVMLRLDLVCNEDAMPLWKNYEDYSV